MNSAVSIVLAVWLLAQAAPVQTLKVRHDHDPWGKCRGELVISQSGIEYRTDKKKHQRAWSWTDIQSLDRKSDEKFSILSYEDQKLRLGADRRFDFSVLSGEEGLGEETFRLIATHLNKPLVDRLARRVDVQYQVPVKHLHTLGGCEGILYFGREWVVFQADQPLHTRTWSRNREVDSVWSVDRFQLEIRVYEEYQKGFAKARLFRFQLKQPLDQKYYQRLRRELVSRW